MTASTEHLFQDIKTLLHHSRKKVVNTINSTMVHTYFEIGRLIVEHEQGGKAKAVYGKETLKVLSRNLLKEFDKGFSVDNLENMRKFYLTYGKSETVSRKFSLSWSHYVFLMRLDERERQFYEIESAENNWSLRDTLPEDNQQIFAREYRTYLPSKEEFLAQMEGVKLS